MPQVPGPTIRQSREFSDEELVEIGRRWNNGEASLRALAQEYGCDHMKISRIVHGSSPKKVVPPWGLTARFGGLLNLFYEEAKKASSDLRVIARTFDISYEQAIELVKVRMAGRGLDAS